ncbi:hypothetical protein B0J18DRAFT_441861 [Chaetomium sp. MPI-SDFR-AT-0129]|nr:hypothetical protein B0J18DRAFT_441861 [Chaetomium sp. MPI-SDFR-AT-0129]
MLSLTTVSEEPRDPIALSTDINADDPGFSVPPPIPVPEDDAREILGAAVECCRGLLKTSTLIRNASSRDRFQTALQRSRDTFMDQFDINHTREKYPKLARPGSEWLARRLGRAITLRRQYLRYCREHQDSLAHQDDNSVNSNSNPNQTLNLPLNISSGTSRSGPHLPLGVDSGMSQAGITEPGTTASTLFAGQLDIVQEGPEDDGVSYTSAAHSDVAPGDDVVLELPTLQTLTKDNPTADFECPFCHIIQRFKRDKGWRRHAFSDLKSYVCTMGPAECDLQLFADSNTWFEHELQNHRCTWSCTLCGSGTFRSADSFKEHVQGAHPGFSESETRLLDQASRRALDLIPAADCPFCDEWEQKIRVAMRNDNSDNNESTTGSEGNRTVPPADVLVVTRTQFRRHVASHMEQLALFAASRSTIDPGAEQEHEQGGGSRGSSNAALPSQVLESTSDANNAEPNWSPDPPLHVAAFAGDINEVRRLLGEGADVLAGGETWGSAISAAEAGGHSNIVALLKSPQSDRILRLEEMVGEYITPSVLLTSLLDFKEKAGVAIYEAIDTVQSGKCVVKCFEKFSIESPLGMRNVKTEQPNEIRIHHLASAHPNVLSIGKVVDTSEHWYMILSSFPESNLDDYITEHDKDIIAGQDELDKRLFLQLLDAVEHCHNLGIYHRNLTPENVFVTNGGVWLKLAGFGMATTNKRSEDFDHGSPSYMAPECWESYAPGRSSYECAPADVWALGVMLLKLTTGACLWARASLDDLLYDTYVVQNPQFLGPLFTLTDGATDLFARVFTHNPELRITISELRRAILACDKLTESAPETTEGVEGQPLSREMRRNAVMAWDGSNRETATMTNAVSLAALKASRNGSRETATKTNAASSGSRGEVTVLDSSGRSQ